MTREEILAMEPGRELDALVSEIMEPKPINTLTYRQLEEIDRLKPSGGTYGCWSIESPCGWWELNIDWGDAARDGYTEEVPEYCPSKEPSEDISAAMEVFTHLGWQGTVGYSGTIWFCNIMNGFDDDGVAAYGEIGDCSTASEAICKTVLLATLPCTST